MFLRLFVYGLVIQLLWKEIAAKSGDDNVNGHGCNSQGVCLPGAEDIAVPPRTITADNTCGMPPYPNYCPLGQEIDNCFSCNSSSNKDNHPAKFMIDKSDGYSTSNFDTWWQSQNWQEWPNKTVPLVININISFNKSYVLTGDIRVTFKFTKPAKMVIEKSMDFGQTWAPLQYFADDCQAKYQMEPSSFNCSTNAVLCSEKYSDHNEGPLYFSFLNCYTRQTFWNASIQQNIEATDLRLRLEFPATDGVHGNPNDLHKYFYAISDVQVFGRCQCHGHAPNCEFPKASNGKDYLNEPKCLCKHNTEGVNCERCEPLYNNKTWMAATSMSEPNPCEKCECYNHSESCTFNKTLRHGVCDECEHNTTGYFCEQCEETFYRNLSRFLNDSLVCLECNCAREGITNNGSCSQNVSTIGQCQCKKNVTGRRCDSCQDAYYGYTLPPLGNCIACECSEHGTVDGNLNCNQTTGRCYCKNNTDQRTCSQCKLGFYNFPNTTHEDCLPCHCDYGGTTSDICEKARGQCLCRDEVEGERCSHVTRNHFFPSYDYFLYEAEYQPGNYTMTSNISEYNEYFTGRGYAELRNDQFIEFNITVQVRSNFSLVLRYSDAVGVGSIRVWVRGNRTIFKCAAVNHNISMDHLRSDSRGASWNSSESVTLCPGTQYSMRIAGVDTTNFSIKIDSLMLVPELTALRSYGYLSSLINECQANFTSIKGSVLSRSQCRNATFSAMVELFNGSLACECSDATNNATCEPYGGQCQCKEGVMGRKCDKCRPGFYNFTQDGCTRCACDDLGSQNFVCDEFSGQCLCKKGVEGRACDHCKLYSYGIHTGQGCTSCNCDTTGSINMTCDDVSGKCYCKPGVENKTCNICRENYFNFTEEGCQTCDCDEAGSRHLQCHKSSGECACKSNTAGTKCDGCINGTFSLEKANPSGCIPCFCFNRSNECSPQDGFILSEVRQSNLTILTHARLSRKFQGNQLYSYVRLFQMNVTMSVNISALRLKGVNYTASFRLKTTHCSTPEEGRYCVLLHEKYTLENLTAYQMQSVLADVKEATVNITGELGNGTKISVAMGTAIRGNSGVYASHVENCECPGGYTESSCQDCDTGFTRSISNSAAFVSCVPCSCNNRSKTCDPTSGKCEGCRLSSGYYCQTCKDSVNNNTGCTQCKPTYWHEDIENENEGCNECGCMLNNTLYHNSSVCNSTTGQCSCKSYVGGKRCDRCEENYFNTSHGCRKCPECYGLMKVHVHKLRDLINEVEITVKELTGRFTVIGNNEFAERLSNATTTVDNIYDTANLTASQDPNNLNTTIEDLNNLLSTKLNVKSLETRRDELQLLLNKTSNWIEKAYESLLEANNSRPSIQDLRNVIQSFVQPLERASQAMQSLNDIERSIAQNLTTTAISQIMSTVLSNSTTVNTSLNKNSKEITLLKNDTETTSEFGENTKNASINLSHQANVFLGISKDILKRVTDLAELIEENGNVTKKLSNGTSRPSLEHGTTNVSISLKDAQTQNTKAEHFLNTTEILLNEVEVTKENATNANESATRTLGDAKETRKTLVNFQNISTNAIKMANESLQQINSIKAESQQSIEQIKNVSESVQDGLSSTEEAIGLASQAFDLAWTESQGIGSVYNRSKQLDNHHKNTECSPGLMTNHTKTIRTRSQFLAELLATCPLDEASNTSAKESLTQSKETNDHSSRNYKNTRNIYKQVLESKLKVANIEKVVETKTHKTIVKSHSELFKDLRGELQRLRQAKEKKAILIKQMKKQVKMMKAEIQDLKSLRDSFVNLPPCGQTL